MFRKNLPNPSGPPACDCHFHVFNAGERTVEARYAPVYASPLSAWEVAARKADVTRGVVVQPSFLGIDNRVLLTTLTLDREHLRGVAVVGGSATEAELRHLHAMGVRGIRLNLIGVADDVGAIRDLPVTWWSALVAAELHLELHSDIGRVSVLLPLIPLNMMVVLDHFARPQTASPADETVQAVCRRQRLGGITHVTLSGAYRRGVCAAPLQAKFSAELAAVWRDLLGRDFLLWGSDWPCTNYESAASYPRLRDSLDDWLPDANDRHAALHTNPQRLYWR